MGRVRLLDKISSIWARPVSSTRNRVNGNDAHLLDKLLRFGPKTPTQSPISNNPLRTIRRRVIVLFQLFLGRKYLDYRIFNDHILNCSK